MIKGEFVDAKIVLLPGDGIGPEIVEQAQLALQAIANRFGHQFSFEFQMIGGLGLSKNFSLPILRMAQFLVGRMALPGHKENTIAALEHEMLRHEKYQKLTWMPVLKLAYK